MKKKILLTVLAFFIIFLVTATFVSAAQTKKEALVLTNTDISGSREIVKYIRDNGGDVSFVLAPHAVMAKLPEGLGPKLSLKYGSKITGIYSGKVDTSKFSASKPTVQSAVKFWNRRFELPVKGLRGAIVPGPIKGDAMIPPDKAQKKPFAAPPAGPQPLAAPSDTETSEYMFGDVLVSIVLLESNGTIDPDLENWTAAEESNVDAEISDALNWWVARKPDNVNLTFWFFDINSSYHYKAPTSYEPINRSSSNQTLWINDAMDYLEVPQAGNYFSRARTYDDTIRDNNSMNWAFTIFVIDSSDDADGRFEDGLFAFSYFQGPYTYMTYKNDGYGINNMDAVAAHETGHVFGALDQYKGSGEWWANCTATSGFLSVPNQNYIENCLINVSSIMRSQVAPYTNNATDEYGRGQIGWRDLDNDSIVDVIDSTYNSDNDTDGDGYVDYWDFDDDNDSVVDISDNCQLTEGISYYDGCPDTYAPNLTYNTETDTAGSYSKDWIFVNASAIDPSLSVVNLEWNGTNESFDNNLTDKIFWENKTGLADGIYSFRIFAADSFGNINNTSERIVTLDTTPPVINFTNEGDFNKSTNESFIFVNVTLSDNSSFVNLEWNGTNSSMNGSAEDWYKKVDLVSGENYTFRVFANDSLGNVGATGFSWIYRIQNLAPTIYIMSPPNGTITRSKQPDIQFNFTDREEATGQATLYFNETNVSYNASAKNNSATILTPENPQADGQYWVWVRVADTENTSNVSLNYTVTIDTVAPVISVSPNSSGASGLPLNQNWTYIYIEATDNVELQTEPVLEFDLGTYPAWDSCNIQTKLITCSKNLTGLQDGNHTYRIYVNDTAGNSAKTVLQNVTLDANAPTTTDNSPSGWKKANFVITLSASDSGAGVDYTTYRVDNGNWQNGTNVTINTEGNHTLQYYSVDNAGNVEATKETYAALDKTAPNTTAAGAPAGWSGENATINFTATDNLSGVSKTYYSIDGAAFTEGTAAEVTTDGNHIVKYYSVDNANNSEAEKNATVKIDRSTPITTDNAPNGWQKNNFVVTLTAIDNASGVDYTSYRVDGGGWQNGTSVTINTEGNHTLDYYSVDNAGNVESTRTTYAALDKTPPITTASGVPADWITGNVTVILNATDNLSGVLKTYYSIDGGGFVNGTQIVIATEGAHTIKYYSVDNANNSEIQKNVTVKIDRRTPTTTDNSPNGWQSLDFTVTLSASDNVSGIDYTSYQIDGGGWQNGTSVSINTEGNHTIEYYSADNAGNVEATKETYAALDKTAPNTTASGAPLGWSENNVTITLNATDNLSGVAKTLYSIDNGAFAEGTAVTIADDGNHTVKYYSVDNANNSEAEKSVTIRIDRAAPITTDNSPAGWQKSDFAVALSPSDAASGVAYTTYRIDSGAWANGTSVLINANGNHTIDYYSVDNAGNIESAQSAYAALDKVSPITSAAGVPLNWTSSNATITLTANDNLSGVSKTYYEIDGGGFIEGTQIEINSEGTHVVKYYSTDKANNSEQQHSANVNIDKSSPTTTDNSPQGWQSSDFTITLSATDALSGVSYTVYRIDNGNWVNGTTISVNTEGNHTIEYYSVDNLGNTEQRKIVYASLDKTPPVTTSSDVPDYLTRGNATINFTATDNLSGVEKTFYSLDNGAFEEGTTITIADDGNHTVKYYSVDNAGNIESEKRLSVKVDKNPPITSAAGIDNLWHNSDILITLSSSDAASGVDETYYKLYTDGAAGALKKLSRDGQPAITYEDDDNWIEYWSTDKIGNEENHTIAKGIKIDKTKPTAKIISPASEATISDFSFVIDIDGVDAQVAGVPSGVKEMSALLDGVAVTDNQAIDATQLNGGPHLLALTVTDNASNSDSANSNFVLASPLWSKNNVMVKLGNAKTGNRKIDSDIDKVIADVSESTSADYWQSEWRLTSKELDVNNSRANGKKVFDNEHDAVHRMSQMLKNRNNNLPANTKKAFQDSISNLTKADELLAKLAVQDAKNAPIKNPKNKKQVDSQLRMADEELNRAANELSQNRPDNAVDRFKGAWDHAQHAIEHANKY